MVRSGVGFSEAAEAWLHFISEDRQRKPSTLVDYQSALRGHLLPAFGDRELESITPEEIELWRRSLKGLSNRSQSSHDRSTAHERSVRRRSCVPGGSGL